MTDQALLSICLSYYSSDAIIQAKEVLYAFVNDSIVRRRGDGRAKADLSDMIALLRRIDEDNISIPSFVCDNFRSMPPATGFEAIADHIVNLMGEISTLRSEVNSLRTSHHPITLETLSDLKEDIYDIKNILLQKATQPQFDVTRVQLPSTDSYGTIASSSVAPTRHQSVKSSTSDRNKKRSSMTDVLPNSSKLAHEKPEPVVMMTDATTDEKGIDVSEAGDDQSQQWQVAQSKRKEVIKGVKRPGGALRGVKGTADLYIGRCDTSVSEDDIRKYIVEELGVSACSLM